MCSFAWAGWCHVAYQFEPYLWAPMDFREVFTTTIIICLILISFIKKEKNVHENNYFPFLLALVEDSRYDLFEP